MTKSIFVASSESSKEYAEKIIEIIQGQIDEKYIKLNSWWKNFSVSDITIDKLRTITKENDAGIFILGPDDCLFDKNNTDKSKKYIPRGNVLIEAGMFLMSKGLGNVCICTFEGVKTPSDFSGITTLSYEKEILDSSNKKLWDWLKKIKNKDDKYILANTHGLDNIPPTFLCNKKIIEDRLSLEEREKGAKEIRLMNYAGTSFFSGSTIADCYPDEWQTWFQDALNNGLKATVILTKSDSYAAEDAALYKMYPRNGTSVDKSTIISENKKGMILYKYDNPEVKLEAFETEIALPYALFETIFDDESNNHIKVDLYSPLTNDDGKRPSFIVYKKDNDELYKHFSGVIDAVIGRDDATKRVPLREVSK